MCIGQLTRLRSESGSLRPLLRSQPPSTAMQVLAYRSLIAIGIQPLLCEQCPSFGIYGETRERKKEKRTRKIKQIGVLSSRIGFCAILHALEPSRLCPLCEKCRHCTNKCHFKNDKFGYLEEACKLHDSQDPSQPLFSIYLVSIYIQESDVVGSSGVSMDRPDLSLIRLGAQKCRLSASRHQSLSLRYLSQHHARLQTSFQYPYITTVDPCSSIFVSRLS